ncbi:type III-B CRISPR module RAMP protein Cmr4 [Lachnoclostridium sp. An181]|uniref:type III-B CRISPR module RAMP protein Cmr4 n=1 Tax=Lachnoclostridium sp. An181 TaxID=1965575 RepID=UPI000B3918DA|nr:type III-B CRISPR module RAMP protein Cmr4 [Lachnoclostridium sp. An181]OUP50174.1 type III-B CRISPR module RAMP protein Cmr4 [Lachnoclostridium sp. An181]
MSSIVIKLECITNLHVGNGEVNYNIIDNEVEKDPVTGFPTIHSSGLKGALREFFEKKKGKDWDNEIVNQLFGKGADEDGKPGSLKIMQADMLARPARASAGDKAYYLLTTDTMLKIYNEKMELFTNQVKKHIESNDQKADRNEEAEGILLTKKIKYDEKEIYLVSESDMNSIDLPVMARNKLENGKSVNLWYEEVVPHGSIFTFAVISDQDSLEKLKKGIDGKVVQFGGNASIGYGFCKVTVEGEKKDE